MAPEFKLFRCAKPPRPCPSLGKNRTTSFGGHIATDEIVAHPLQLFPLAASPPRDWSWHRHLHRWPQRRRPYPAIGHSYRFLKRPMRDRPARSPPQIGMSCASARCNRTVRRIAMQACFFIKRNAIPYKICRGARYRDSSLRIDPTFLRPVVLRTRIAPKYWAHRRHIRKRARSLD